MSINFYIWNETDDATKARIMRRSQANIDDVIKIVEPIIADVKLRGDAALVEYAKKFDGADLTSRQPPKNSPPPKPHWMKP